MRCSTCHGTGRYLKTITVPGKTDARLVKVAARHPPLQFNMPCEMCGGTGFAHCCEGERMQPDKGTKEL